MTFVTFVEFRSSPATEMCTTQTPQRARVRGSSGQGSQDRISLRRNFNSISINTGNFGALVWFRAGLVRIAGRAIAAGRAAVEGAELHRFRKTYADTLHEEGVSVNTIRIRLGHVLRKNMSRASIERAVRNIATVRQTALASHDNAIALPGVAMNVIIGCPGTSVATSVMDAVQTAAYSVALAEKYGIPVDLNLHPYYPSKRGTARFANHSRPSVETTLEAASAIAQSVGNRAVIFIGLEDEGHDQNPSGRAEYFARIFQATDHFNRTGQSDIFRQIS